MKKINFGAASLRGISTNLLCWLLLTFAGTASVTFAESYTVIVASPVYTAVLTTDTTPRILLTSRGEVFFRLPIVSGLSSTSGEEILTEIRTLPITTDRAGVKTLVVTAKSSLWQSRHFVWRLFADHIEFQQFAEGERPIARCYFFSNGVSGYFDKGTSQGIRSDTIIDADRYFAPNPSLTNQLTHTIEQPQSLGVNGSPYTESVESVSRAANSRLFSPPPLSLSFRHRDIWSSIGIGTLPGRYQFNGLEFSGEHYSGASFWVDYQGRLKTATFESPVAAINFGSSAFDVMRRYVHWVDARGFSTQRTIPNVKWHQLPIFCGWGEQTAIAGSETSSVALAGHLDASALATQENYTKWVAELDKREIPVSTIIIDDKWMKAYGTLEIDERKWPDMKGFIEKQHARGRHVLLWIPMASAEGLPISLTAMRAGRPISADVSNPEYQAFLRRQIHHLIVDIGVDGFKEDWIEPPRDFSDVQQHGELYGMEWVHRFQSILFNEAHKWKKDAMVETQTPNPLYRDSSDVLRLNDIYCATRGVPAVMRIRAEIAHIAGWNIVDTDNAATTTGAEWWTYMQLQPFIGIPSLYIVTETVITHERPSAAEWSKLAAIWRKYIDSVSSAVSE